MSRLNDAWLEVALLGPSGFAFRLWHETLNRSGLKRHTQPAAPDASTRWRGSWEAAKGPAESWLDSNRAFFTAPITPAGRASILKLRSPRPGADALSEDATPLARHIRCFSRWEADFGDPIDWHLNPISRARWPATSHFSDVLRHGSAGDVKLTWEVGRFPQAFAFVRVWAATADERWPRLFLEQVQSWERANPYRVGVHWASGQELAVRTCAWLFALKAFDGSVALTPEAIERCVGLLYLHGEHIAANIDYARYSVHNNHLVGEALGLYLIGAYLPWFRESTRWRKTGRRLLETDCLSQFYSDGGYCQASHTYHRLALQYYVWALRAGEALGEPFQDGIYDLLRRSRDYLVSFINEDGRLPNWGPNDGACLNPWTDCDYADFRPIIDSLTRLTDGKRAFPDGPWTEEALWLWGADPPQRETRSLEPKSASFPASGLHVLRENPGTFAVLRCGSVRDRFGQADQLHVDLWWQGVNIAQDGGSYLYNDELAYHRHFMGTASHNTVTVDGLDQMKLHRRFKWLHWTKAHLLHFGPSEVAGEHYGYRFLPGRVVHRRRLILGGNGRFDVVDELDAEVGIPHAYVLHWLLADYASEQRADGDGWLLVLATPKGRYGLRLWARPGQATLSICRGVGGDAPDGWVSRYYGEKQPAPSVRLQLSALGPVSFCSSFLPL